MKRSFQASGDRTMLKALHGGVSVVALSLAMSAPALAQASVVVTGDVQTPLNNNPVTPQWNAGVQLFVGHTSDGTLTISGGGPVTNMFGAVGNAAEASGTVTVTGSGSTWTNSGSLTIAGPGSLTIADGGTVSNGIVRIGFNDGSEGAVTVTGADSEWTNSRNLTVGESGTGTLTVEDGGMVSNTAGTIGFGDGSMGTVTVSGAGWTWTSSGDLYVGQYGTGELTIAEGGTVTVDGVARIADQSSSTGTLNIGAAAGAEAVAAGSLSASEMTLRDGTGTLVFNHTDTDYSFDSALVSEGTSAHAIDH